MGVVVLPRPGHHPEIEIGARDLVSIQVTVAADVHDCEESAAHVGQHPALGVGGFPALMTTLKPRSGIWSASMTRKPVDRPCLMRATLDLSLQSSSAERRFGMSDMAAASCSGPWSVVPSASACGASPEMTCGHPVHGMRRRRDALIHGSGRRREDRPARSWFRHPTRRPLTGWRTICRTLPERPCHHDRPVDAGVAGRMSLIWPMYAGLGRESLRLRVVLPRLWCLPWRGLQGERDIQEPAGRGRAGGAGS